MIPVMRPYLGEEEAGRMDADARAGEFVRLRVSDSGHGIPADVLPRIFEPYFTTKEVGKGTGLGLAMVFGIVKQHQGWIVCSSTPGQGTTFEIHLPRLTEALAAPPALEPTPAGSRSPSASSRPPTSTTPGWSRPPPATPPSTTRCSKPARPVGSG